ncbi:type VI secretion system Vgr family protein [uncultured Cedecea sp.]|uniref:type VI secretion system Vgr family protein n=1 Tax=uncultured Cedecea sp. TaxID=988762 RepID=UPI00261F2F59|nr:type VI secretion system Vgr family protein [uncultured Cedecea sp.]
MSTHFSLIFSHRHHLLAVKGCDADMDVLAFEGTEALSTPFSYRIEFTSTNHAISKEMMLMKNGSLTLRALINQGVGIKIQQPVRVIQGVVSGFERLGTSKDETLYALTLEPRLALLDRSHQNAIYQDMSVPQIVEKILRERHNLRGQDFLFSLTKEYPRREQVMQYGEDDLHFITRLLGEVGIWFRFTTDTRLNIDVVEFYDSQQGYEKVMSLPSVPPSGQHAEGADSVWGMTSSHNVVQKQVSTRDYNYRQATQDMDIAVDASRGETITYGEAYHYADNFLTQGSTYDLHPAPESGAFYARIRHERYLNGQTRAGGITSSPTLCLGQVLEVTGGYEVEEVFNRGLVITAMRTHARRDEDFGVHFDGIPDSSDFCFRPNPDKRPVMAGTLPARVTSTTENDTYGHIDKAGRYRVNMLFDRDSWETGFESLWVRQSRPYAGDTYGLHLPLLAGSEVAIGFEDGNPDRPYIQGVMHDSAHGDHVTIHNYKRNVLRTPSNNKIRLDDERGKEHIKISTEYGGKSQLNLGHLVDAEKQQRGEGFELRTDAWGAIRAEKGIFITADRQTKGQGQVLDMEPAIARISAAVAEMESLSACAQQAQALAADVGRQQELLNKKLEKLQQEVLLASASQGIALASGEDMLLSASDNLTLTAGKQLDVGAQRDFTLAVGKQLSLYSREGAKLYSSQNDIDIQAQGGNITTWSTQDTYISSGKKLVVTAQDELTLICGGGYIKINDGNVEIGGPGKLRIKNGGIKKSGSGSMQSVMKSFEPSTFDEKFVVTHPVSDKPLVNQHYDIHLQDGSVLSGVTDEQGHSSPITSKSVDALKIALKKSIQKANGGESD